MESRLDEMRWLSYAELARAKAISKRAAIRLASRHGWQHRPDNRGPVRVGVPASVLGQQGRRAAWPMLRQEKTPRPGADRLTRLMGGC